MVGRGDAGDHILIVLPVMDHLLRQSHQTALVIKGNNWNFIPLIKSHVVDFIPGEWYIIRGRCKTHSAGVEGAIKGTLE